MSELSKLREDHATLARMFLKLEHIIEQPHPPAEVELFEFRRSLMSTLIAHLKLEDWALYPRLIDSEDEEASRAGQSFKDEWAALHPPSSAIAINGPPRRSPKTGPLTASIRAIFSMR